MAIVQPTYNHNYLMQDFPKGRRALVSSMEIACATAPKYLGQVEAQEVAEDTFLGFIMAAGNEMTVPADQVTWSEKLPDSSVVQIVGNGLVSRTGNDFTINASAIIADPSDIDECRPDEAKFYVAVGQRFVAVDVTGKRNIGVVTAISSDGKTITASYRDTGSAWTIATTNLDIIWLGYNLDHCECPPCIGYRPYTPTYENSMYKDGVCAKYCEETMIAEGGWAAFPERQIGQYNFTTDELLDSKMKEAAKRIDNIMAWERRTPKAVADAAGEPQGTKGVFQQLEERALKVEGTIDDKADLVRIANYLKKKGVKTAYLDATPEQYVKLMAIADMNVTLQINPFENHQTDLIYLGYKGINVYGVEILFREWSGLSGIGSTKLGKAYNFIITPAGKTTITLNGQKKQVGYANIVWFGSASDVYKFKRDSNENDMNCGNIEIKYTSKFLPLLVGLDRFILGVNP